MSMSPLRAGAGVRLCAPLALFAQPSAPAPEVTILRPARVFDGDALHEGWAVRVRGGRIDAVGPAGERRGTRRAGRESSRA
jgi:hypothetical protein